MSTQKVLSRISRYNRCPDVRVLTWTLAPRVKEDKTKHKKDYSTKSTIIILDIIGKGRC